MGTNTMWGTPAKLSDDGNGNTVLVGADGAGGQLGANSLSTVLLGDSITENCGGIGTATSYKYNNFGYFTYLNARLRGALDLVANLGISGQTMQTLLTRIDSEVIPYRPGLAIWLMSGNDIVQGVSTETLIGTIRGIVKKLRDAGIHILVGTIPPRATSGTGSFSTVLMRQQVQIANRLILSLAATSNGIRVADTTTTLADMATGLPKTGVMKDSPAIHPGPMGAWLLAEAFADSATTLVSGPHPLAHVGADYNLVATALGSWLNNAVGGTVTDTITTAETGSDGEATWLQTVITAMSAIGTIRQFYHPLITTGFSVGDVIQGALEYECDSSVDIRAVNFQIVPTGGTNSCETCSENVALDGVSVNSARPLKRGIILTGRYTVEESVTGLTPKLRIVAASASAAGTFRFRNPVIHNITTAGY